jgi:Trk K+ transport system NAD-binding subunit
MLTEMEDVILVPQRSTFEIQDFTYVYTVDEEGKVSVRSFEPLSRHGAYYVTKDLPDNTLVVMVKRQGRFFVPSGNTHLTAGDKLLLISDSADDLKALRQKQIAG